MGTIPAYCHHFNLLRLIVIVRINVLHKDLHNLHNVEPWDSASIHNFLCFPLIVNDWQDLVEGVPSNVVVVLINVISQPGWESSLQLQIAAITFG